MRSFVKSQLLPLLQRWCSLSPVGSGWWHKRGHLFYHELQGFLGTVCHAPIPKVGEQWLGEFRYGSRVSSEMLPHCAVGQLSGGSPQC